MKSCLSLKLFISPAELRLMAGDELRLRYLGELHKPWSGMGHVVKTPTTSGEEVGDRCFI